MIVYLLTNVINGKQYVGKTVGKLAARWNRHKYDSCNRIRDTLLGRAVRKYGAKNFVPSVLANADTEVELAQLEQDFIYAYQSNHRQFGYNLTDGGEGSTGFQHSDETKQLLRKQKTGSKNVGFGKPISSVLRAAIVAANKARVWTAAMRKNRGDSQRGAKNHRFGVSVSEETRHRASEAKLGEKNPNFKRRLV